MIHIHTDELMAAVSSLRAANGEVDHASQQLQQITTHNDWTCKERNRINQNVEDLRRNIRRLQEDTERYLQAASNAADAFVTEENNIKSLFPGVDSVIGGLLNIGGAAEHMNNLLHPKSFQDYFQEKYPDRFRLWNPELISHAGELLQGILKDTLPIPLQMYENVISGIKSIPSIVDFSSLQA